MIVIPPQHRFAAMDVVHWSDLHEEAYVNRVNCEFGAYAGGILRERGIQVRRVLKSTREDWIQAMIMAGFGFGFFPEFAVTMPGVEKRLLVDPEMTRSVCLVTVRGRPHSPAVGAFVRSARCHKWPGGQAAQSQSDGEHPDDAAGEALA